MEDNKSMEVFAKAPIRKAVLQNALPAMAAMLMVLIYNLADTFFIGQTQGLNAFIDRQKQSFEQYLADKYEIASNARLETLEDGTILLVMCEDQYAVFDAIRDTIEGAA